MVKYRLVLKLLHFCAMQCYSQHGLDICENALVVQTFFARKSKEPEGLSYRYMENIEAIFSCTLRVPV